MGALLGPILILHQCLCCHPLIGETHEKRGANFEKPPKLRYQWDDVLVDTIFDCSIEFLPLNSLLLDYVNYFSGASPCFGTCNPYVRLCLMPQKNKTNQRPDISKKAEVPAQPASFTTCMDCGSSWSLVW